MCPLDLKSLTGRRHELVAELTAPRDPHVHFTTFENSIFVQKQTLVKLLKYMPDPSEQKL